MRVMPLHNIRQAGLIPNGFQKEEASPPAPDPRMQPEIRNRVLVQTDTRHAIEIFNPGTRLETNDINRTKNTDPPRIEMGQERWLDQSASRETVEKSPQLNDAYERLLRILLGREPSARHTAYRPARYETEKPLEMEGMGVPGNQEIKAYHQAAHLDNLVNDRNKTVPTYYQRRGVEAYRTMQAFAPGSSVLREA